MLHMYTSEDDPMWWIVRLIMKVVFITSAYLVTTNPYTQRYFRMLKYRCLHLLDRAVHQAARTVEQERPLLWLMWPMEEDFCLSSALHWHFGFHTGIIIIFFSVEFLRSRKCSRTWYNNILSYHNVNGTSLVFLPIFFSLLSDLGTGFFHVWIALKWWVKTFYPWFTYIYLKMFNL